MSEPRQILDTSLPNNPPLMLFKLLAATPWPLRRRRTTASIKRVAILVPKGFSNTFEASLLVAYATSFSPSCIPMPKKKVASFSFSHDVQ